MKKNWLLDAEKLKESFFKPAEEKQVVDKPTERGRLAYREN
jgi:hypothetical protein